VREYRECVRGLGRLYRSVGAGPAATHGHKKQGAGNAAPIVSERIRAAGSYMYMQWVPARTHPGYIALA